MASLPLRAALVATAFAACSGSTVTPRATADAADVPSLDRPAADVPPATDVPRDTPAPDVPPDDAAAPDAAAPDDAPPVDAAIDPGMCGLAVRRCLCGCGADGACQSGCIARDEACGGCIYVAMTRCCAGEATVFEDCVDRNMCGDEACLRSRCAAEVSALETCFANGQTRDPACQGFVRECLGPDHPRVRCPM